MTDQEGLIVIEATQVEDITAAEEDLAEDQTLTETKDQERCIRQLAPNVARNVKFLSSQHKASLSTAENVSRSEEIVNPSLTSSFYF